MGIWTIEALKNEHDLTLITTEDLDLNRLNDFFGSRITENEMEIIRIRNPFPMLGGFLLKVSLAQRYFKQHRRKYDLGIATRGEMDLGNPAVQYVHCPIWDDLFLRNFDQISPGWKHGKNPLRTLYKALCKHVSGYDQAVMKKNVTLVNSDWMGAQVKKIYGIDALTVYPPVADDFTRVDWDDREPGFVSLGKICPSKRTEDILKIFGGVRDQMPQTHLHLIGNCSNKSYELKISRLIEKQGNGISWEKGRSRNQTAALLAGHKFGIHAMRYEHFGISVAEMAKAGCLPFVHDSGGPVEIIREDQLRFNGNDDAIDKILRLLRNEELQFKLRKKTSENSRRFSTDIFVDSIRKIVNGL